MLLIILNSMSSNTNQHRTSGLDDPDHYCKRPYKTNTCTNYRLTEQGKLLFIRKLLITKLGYEQYFGESVSANLEHYRDNIIFNGDIFFSAGHCLDCANSHQIQQRSCPHFLNGNVLRVSITKHINIAGRTLILHLDNFLNQKLDYFNVESIVSLAYG